MPLARYRQNPHRFSDIVVVVKMKFIAVRFYGFFAFGFDITLNHVQ